ncbi:MAG: exodeoxyribonuclease VII large subunit, partial [Candidatus Paceibacteria bacterium]
LIVPDARELRTQIDRSIVLMEHTLTSTLQRYTHRVDSSLSTMERYFRRTREKVNTYTQRLASFMDMYAQKTSYLQTQVKDHYIRMDQAMERMITRYREQVDATTRVLQQFDYRKSLERGYSIMRKNGKIITKAAEIQPGDTLQTEMADGYIETNVIDTYETKQSS